MKSFVTVATMISLAAGSPAMAQPIQESFHSVTAQICVESFEEADNLVTINTNQQLLSNSLGAVTLIIDEQRRELEQAVVISFYVDQTTG